jgi:hypothetical protein
MVLFGKCVNSCAFVCVPVFLRPCVSVSMCICVPVSLYLCVPMFILSLCLFRRFAYVLLYVLASLMHLRVRELASVCVFGRPCNIR